MEDVAKSRQVPIMRKTSIKLPRGISEKARLLGLNVSGLSRKAVLDAIASLDRKTDSTVNNGVREGVTTLNPKMKEDSAGAKQLPTNEAPCTPSSTDEQVDV